MRVLSYYNGKPRYLAPKIKKKIEKPPCSLPIYTYQIINLSVTTLNLFLYYDDVISVISYPNEVKLMNLGITRSYNQDYKNYDSLHFII